MSAAAPAMLACLLAACLALPACGHVQSLRWYLPTKSTATLPCFSGSSSGAFDLQRERRVASAFYRWTDSNGGVVSEGFYQTVRLLRMTENDGLYHVRALRCLVYDWKVKLVLAINHTLHFYERPAVTDIFTVSFLDDREAKDFARLLKAGGFESKACKKMPSCAQIVVLHVRNPLREYPVELDGVDDSELSLLGSIQRQLRSRLLKPLYKVNQVSVFMRHRHASSVTNCNIAKPDCYERLQREATEAQKMFISEAARGIKSSTGGDGRNRSTRHLRLNLCPPGSEPLDPTGRRLRTQVEKAAALACGLCPPGTVGSNGLDCFRAPHGHFARGRGCIVPEACPKNFFTVAEGAASRADCIFNGSLPARWSMQLLRHLWTEVESLVHSGRATAWSALLALNMGAGIYCMCYQAHLLQRASDYRSRSFMAIRLMKRFAAEAFLRDIRRRYFWEVQLKSTGMLSETEVKEKID